MNAIDWNDRMRLQKKWTNEEKGWKVKVEWKRTCYGTGVFANENIKKGTLLRVGQNLKNHFEFRKGDDIEAFCTECGIESSSELYLARLNYVSDYLYGFFLDTDDRGYPLKDETPDFIGMWIPGNGLNHSEKPNIVYKVPENGTDEGMNLVALTDIPCGSELLDDYRRFGKAPSWILRFAKKGISLNFKTCNDFV